jgi:hypothetical protein
MPLPIIVARVGWMALGAIATAVSATPWGKEFRNSISSGVSGLMKDMERDYYKNKKLVDDIKKGKQK